MRFEILGIFLKAMFPFLFTFLKWF